MLDLPTAQVARSTHHFLLPMGAGAYLVLCGTHWWLRDGVVWLVLGSFIVLAWSRRASSFRWLKNPC